MNIKTIADALATTIGTVTAYGETATATASLPNQVTTLGLLVYPPAGNLALVMGGPMLNAHLTFPVMLLRDPFSMPDRTDALLAWATALWPRPQSNYDLDVAGVVECRATDIRIEIEGQVYGTPAGEPGNRPLFDVVELTVDVHVYELTTVTL